MVEYKAVVFDMDGVIFDSERMCIESWKEVADKHNIPDIETSLRKCLGVNVYESKRIMLSDYGENFDYDRFSKEASDIFHERFDGGRLPMKPGVVELLEFLKGRHIGIALASSTREATVRQELTDAGIIQYFDKIVCGDMVKKSKPEPDIFLKACEMLSVEPAYTYAIEDSYNGIRSAYAAGMHPIMVPDLLQPTEEIKGLAEVVLESLFDVKEYLA